MGSHINQSEKEVELHDGEDFQVGKKREVNHLEDESCLTLVFQARV